METYLWPLYTHPPYVNGFGLQVKVNGKGASLMVDTGASGILLSPAKAARAGIIPRWQSTIMGVGGKGESVL
jgi:predicted aspartyl protease